MIPEEDLVAVRALAGDDHYQQINTALREQDDEVLDRFDTLIRCAVSGINQLPPFLGVVISGADVDDAHLTEFLGGYAPGRVLHEPAFVSTTWDPRLTVPGNVRFEILSRHGHDISRLSPYGAAEAEVLFGPGYRFTVVSRTHDAPNRAWRIRLIEGAEPRAADTGTLTRLAAEHDAVPARDRRPIARPERFSLPIGWHPARQV